MEDYIRQTTPPGTFEIKLDEGRLCSPEDDQGRLVFFGKEGLPTSLTEMQE